MNGKISSEARAFFMGHKGTIERKYTLNKHKLPYELAKGMRNQYVQASSFLVAEQITLESIDEKINKAREEARAQVEAEYEPQIKGIQEKMNAFFNTLNDEEKKRYFECIRNSSTVTV